MHVWVIRDAEPLPTDPGNKRLMRIGTLCQALAERGHQVTWITSTFDHYQKRQRAEMSTGIDVEENYRIELLKAPGYPKNVSLARILHNRAFAGAFMKFASASPTQPDVMVTDIPTTESAAAVVRLGRRTGVPSVLSIRDLWPDFFASFMPASLRPVGKALLLPLHRQATYACRHADVLIGISEAYLEWGMRKGARAPRSSDGVVPLGYRASPQSHVADAGQRNAVLAHMGVDPDKRVVAFVGTWGATSDLETVAAAAKILRDREDIQFVVAGTGNTGHGEASLLRELKNVVLPGWLDGRQIGILLDHAAVGLLPYRDAAPQGLPNKLFAYMSHGAFQVSTLGGEAARLLEDNGLGKDVAKHDPAAMARAIAEAVDGDVPRARIRTYFDDNFSHEHVYGRFIEMIGEAAARGKGKAPGKS